MQRTNLLCKNINLKVSLDFLSVLLYHLANEREDLI